MKSHQTTLLAIYEGIFCDAAEVWADLQSSLDKDLSYLRRALKERGLPFVLATLPTLGKVIDKSLSKGAFMHEDVPLGIPLHHGKLRFLGGLASRVFDDEGVCRDDADVVAIQYLRTICYLAKKYRIGCPPSALKEALDEFFEIERLLPPPVEGTWDEMHPHFIPLDGHPHKGHPPELYPDIDFSLEWSDFRRLCGRVISQLGEPDWWSITPRHGPGVVSEREGFISKYEFPSWPQKLAAVFPFDWFGQGILDTPHEYSEQEVPSRLIAVPKTYKGPRLICAEPLSHQWMQQGIWRWLEEKIKRSVLGRSINFRSQQRSRLRALHASSVDGDATVDLSSASDRLSARLVHYVFQSNTALLRGFHAVRTQYLSQTISPDHGKLIRLRKFAPMGSALTFPVQSIVYALICVHAIRVSEGRSANWRNWEADFDRVVVFGDDIIIPKTAYSTVRLLLEELGLKVNDHKSYSDGYFRESCGLDAYKGSEVTPAYILQPYDGSATSTASIVEVSNNFFKKGYWNTAHAIETLLPVQERKLLAVVGGDVSGLGLFSFMGHSFRHLKSVYNHDLQKEEHYALAITTKVKKEQGQGLSGLTQYFTEDPSLSDISGWESGQVRSVRVRKTRTRVSL